MQKTKSGIVIIVALCTFLIIHSNCGLIYSHYFIVQCNSKAHTVDGVNVI